MGSKLDFKIIYCGRNFRSTRDQDILLSKSGVNVRLFVHRVNYLVLCQSFREGPFGYSRRDVPVCFWSRDYLLECKSDTILILKNIFKFYSEWFRRITWDTMHVKWKICRQDSVVTCNLRNLTDYILYMKSHTKVCL